MGRRKRSARLLRVTELPCISFASPLLLFLHPLCIPSVSPLHPRCVPFAGFYSASSGLGGLALCGKGSLSNQPRAQGTIWRKPAGAAYTGAGGKPINYWSSRCVLKRSGNIFRVGVFRDFVGLPHVRTMGHTCGEPDEI